MLRFISATAMTVAVASAHVSTQVPTLRSQVKAHGRDLVLELRVNSPVPDFQTLVAESDTIVVGTIEFGTPVLTHEDSMLETDYRLKVQRIIRQSASAKVNAGDTLVVRRLGGVMPMEGFNVSMSDPDFLPFNAGETYVLFLTNEPSEVHPRFRYGGQNAYLVTPDDSVKQASLRGAWNRERGVVSLQAFLSEVQTIISAAR